jgi:GNAT superfamily N-acetyltransferase
VGVIVERIRTDQWELLRDLRIRALTDDPHAFSSNVADERAHPSDAWKQRAAQRAVGDAAATFVAFVDDEPAGIVGCHRLADDPRSVELVSMWTSGRHRRNGVGRALVDAVVDWAESCGATRVVLWVMRGNGPARALYEAVGFEPTDEPAAAPDDPCRNEQRMVRRLS